MIFNDLAVFPKLSMYSGEYNVIIHEKKIMAKITKMRLVVMNFPLNNRYLMGYWAVHLFSIVVTSEH